jgi:hypothetical protein
MSFVSAAALITYGTVAAAGAGYLAASMGADAVSDAANTAAGAQNNATQVANDQFNKQVELQQPFYDVGKGAIPDFQKMISGGYDMKESPAAQYELRKGTQALNRALASRGLSGSGNAVNRLTELNQSVAAKDWQNQYSRILDALKLGTGASSSMGNAGNALTSATQSGANNLGNIAMQQGGNQASLYAGIPGATANMAATGLNAYNAYNRGQQGGIPYEGATNDSYTPNYNFNNGQYTITPGITS